MNVLVTGAAGFIGARTCIKLIQENFNVMGIDNLNDYYDVQLKKRYWLFLVGLRYLS